MPRHNTNPLEAEGGGKSWPRPPMPTINEKRDSISVFPHHSSSVCSLLNKLLVFQQIDIETASHPENHKVVLRMYGVTEVWYI